MGAPGGVTGVGQRLTKRRVLHKSLQVNTRCARDDDVPFGTGCWRDCKCCCQAIAEGHSRESLHTGEDVHFISYLFLSSKSTVTDSPLHNHLQDGVLRDMTTQHLSSLPSQRCQFEK